MPVRVVTFGCRLNSYESAAIKEMDGLEDDIIVVNTCAVTGEAERQCRQTVRKLRRENPNAFLVVTGCAAQIAPDAYAKMPEVDKVLGNNEKLDPNAYKKTAPALSVGDIDSPDAPLNAHMPFYFEGRNRAFIQIQQGCDHACTFCIVTKARGKNKSLPPEKIIAHAQKLADEGYPEIGLTGVDITSYPDLAGLTKRLLKEVSGLKRLRLGSLDPAAVDDGLIALFANSDILMPHLHLSVQSGDDLILKRMARRHLRKDVLELCEKIRTVRPDAVFGADFITGFPTETERMFENTLDLVCNARLTHLHVFPYSVRPGTPAAKMPQVPVPVRKERAKRLRDEGNALLNAYMQSRIGSEAHVLYETDGKGLCEHYLSVKIGEGFRSGDIIPVRLTGIAETGVFEGSVL